ncbi:MAG TPA: ROK family protein [Clostridiales bacterium]|nr:ROK family protein [Clostridiales bacterium]
MKYYIGIDIGGTNLRAAVLDKSYNIIDKFKIDNKVKHGAKENIDMLISIIKEKWNAYDIKGVGVACPGPLDIKNGIILNPPNLPGWEGFELKKYFQKQLELPVVVNNDANIAGYCEARVGSASDVESVYYITLSTGVGGGFIYKGEIVNGAYNNAGEICNMIINEDSYSHSGLNPGGLEGQCSGNNIARIASKSLGRRINTKEVFDLVADGDELCKEILYQWTINVSKAIANIITVVDPHVIVLGGSVILNNIKWLGDIIREVKLRVIETIAVDIRLAQIGDDAGLVGAGVLASNTFE